jgi:hypothetical protein
MDSTLLKWIDSLIASTHEGVFNNADPEAVFELSITTLTILQSRIAGLEERLAEYENDEVYQRRYVKYLERKLEEASIMATEEARREEILRTLDGVEITSEYWAGVITVRDGQIIRDGLIIEPMPTLEEARTLLNEMVHQEFGTDEELAALLDREFGNA